MEKNIPHQPSLVDDDRKVMYTSPGDWLKVVEAGRFYYAERKGVDSIAFILFATNVDDPKRIGVVKELKQPIGDFKITAFGGSIDNEKYYEDLCTLVIDEVIEESGFTITKDNIEYYGKYLVSSQMNQHCHLFGINVDKHLQGLKTTTNPAEMQSIITWLTLPEAMELEDWKTIVIISKRLSSAQAILHINSVTNVKHKETEGLNHE